MKGVSTKEQPKAGTVQKIFTAIFFVLMASLGLANIVIGLLNMDLCGNAMVMPVLLVANGVLWLLPALLTASINCFGQHHDLTCLFGCLEKLLLLCLAFIVASTIYMLVSVCQVKTLDTLCVHAWLPPYTLAIVMADWLCFVVFFRVFCVHSMPAEDPPTVEFKHLKNLPPLVFPWNRHRAIRTY